MELNVTAPSFSLTDIYDRPISLESFRGKKVFLGFFRHAGCPFCNLRVHALQKHQDALKAKNLEMIFFFESKKRLLLASSFHKGVMPIPIISDPEKTWYDAYGIESSATKSAKSHLTHFIQQAIAAKLNKLPVHPMKDGESIYTMPAEFLLDEDGVIRKIHYCSGLTDRLSIEFIHEFANIKRVASK